jgi:hypothetical protein
MIYIKESQRLLMRAIGFAKTTLATYNTAMPIYEFELLSEITHIETIAISSNIR